MSYQFEHASSSFCFQSFFVLWSVSAAHMNKNTLIVVFLTTWQLVIHYCLFALFVVCKLLGEISGSLTGPLC